MKSVKLAAQTGRGFAVLAVAAIAVALVGSAGHAAAQGLPSADAPAAYVAMPARAAVAPAMGCAALAGHEFPQVKDGPARILSAEVEVARAGRAEFCLVKGYVAPNIQFELRLPTSGYSGRYLQLGCGGSCGIIPGFIMPACENKPAFSGAFAVGAENSGHSDQMSGNDIWALGGKR